MSEQELVWFRIRTQTLNPQCYAMEVGAGQPLKQHSPLSSPCTLGSGILHLPQYVNKRVGHAGDTTTHI